MTELKVRYPKETYGVEGLLGVRYWNNGDCSVAIVAKKGYVDDWAAYIGALPNKKELGFVGGEMQYGSVTEEEVVRYVVQNGAKLDAATASRLFELPVKAYRR